MPSTRAAERLKNSCAARYENLVVSDDRGNQIFFGNVQFHQVSTNDGTAVRRTEFHYIDFTLRERHHVGNGHDACFSFQQTGENTGGREGDRNAQFAKQNFMVGIVDPRDRSVLGTSNL